jgi:hypothetical protein
MNANERKFLDGVAGACYWPTFHDAEVLSLTLERKGLSRPRVHTWHMTNQVDERGHYVLTKQIAVGHILQNDGHEICISKWSHGSTLTNSSDLRSSAFMCG